jgi:glucose-1-phosphate adenylyltransferase
MGRPRVRRDDVIVVILGGGRGTRLDPLTRLRSKPAVPIAGKYRLIDLPISNSLHSGMERIFVLTQYNSVSLHRHLVSTYSFGRFSRGFVDVLAAQQTPGDTSWFQGTADAVRQNLRYITEHRAKYALILSGDHVYRLDYNLLIEEHERADADVTIAVLPCSEAQIGEFGAVRVDEAGRVVEFREKPRTPEAREGMAVPADLLAARGVAGDRPYLASMGIYLFSTEALEAGLDSTHVDFGKDLLPAAVGERKVQAHFFDGYWRDIGTIRAFYEAHMDLTRPRPAFDFHDPDWVIYTHPRYLPGSRMDRVQILRSMIAEGVKIVDSHVERSIVGIRSVIREARLRSALLMGADEQVPDVPGAPPVGIGPGSVVENAIVDKNARIGRDVRISNERGVDRDEGEGWVIRDGIVVITKGAVIPDGSVI